MIGRPFGVAISSHPVLPLLLAGATMTAPAPRASAEGAPPARAHTPYGIEVTARRPAGVPPALPGRTWRGEPMVAVNEKTGTSYYCGPVDLTPGTIGIAIVPATFTGGTPEWGAPVIAHSVKAARAALEQPWLVADSTSGDLYLAWVTIERRAASHISFQRSTDGGASWSRPVQLSGRTAGGRVLAPRLAAGPNGELYAAWATTGNGPTGSIRVRASRDRGAGWGSEAAFATLQPGHGAGAAVLAVDRTRGAHRGRVHLAWTGSAGGVGDSLPAAGRAGDVLAAHSDDGTSWSEPATVTTAASPEDARLTGIAVAADGMPYVAWSARHSGVSHPYVSRSGDGGASWSPPRALEGGEDPWTDATPRIATGFDLTACQGNLAAGPGSSVRPSWTVTNGNTLFANRYEWTLASARDWPRVAAGTVAAGAGGTGAILPTLAIPDSAAAGVNRICLTLSDPGRLNVRECCFEVTVERAPAGVPVLASTFDLRAGAPDPVSKRTRIDYSLPHAGPATLGIYDLRGEPVRTLASGDRPAGPWSITWDGRDDHGARAGAGAYLCRLEAPGNLRIQRLIWVR